MMIATIILLIVIGITLIINGGINYGSVKKLSGDDTSVKNISNLAILNIVVGSLMIVGGIGLGVFTKKKGTINISVTPTGSVLPATPTV